MGPTLKIELLGKNHHREGFDCGVDALDIFLKKYANQNQKNHISKTFVAVDEKLPTVNHKKEILGFYTLASGEMDPELLPEKFKHPRHPVSVAKLARLAVDLKHQGKNIGRILLDDAFGKIKSASQIIGIFAVIVDAKDAIAKSFYHKFGFVEVQDSNLKLFMPMELIEKLY